MVENLHVSFGKESPITLAGMLIFGILMLVLEAALATFGKDSDEALHDKLKDKEKKLKEKEEKLKKIEEQLREVT